jgi:hypothetical protein
MARIPAPLALLPLTALYSTDFVRWQSSIMLNIPPGRPTSPNVLVLLKVDGTICGHSLV